MASSRLPTAEIISQGHYLGPGFDPSTLSVAQLMGVLRFHNINPTTFTKSKLIQMFNNEIKHNTKYLEQERSVRRGGQASEHLDGLTAGPSFIGQPLMNARIQRYIQSSLGLPEHAELISISASEAQAVLDEVWKALDVTARPLPPSTDANTFNDRNKLRKLSLKLSITHNILPASLILKGVRCTNNNQAGAGSFADVFIGTFRGTKVALKRPRIYLMAGDQQKEKLKQLFHRESLLWKNLVHSHIVPFLGVSEDVFQDMICMVLPWMDNGSLRHYVESKRKQGFLIGNNYVAAIDKWLYQISDGLSYLHDEGLVHGDMHSGNVLIDAVGNACLTDFGMALTSDATSYGYGSLHGGGATRWKAPELIDPDEFDLGSSRPTTASDVFSFACICIELYSGQPPMPELTDNQVSRRYVKGQRPDRPSLPDGGRMADILWSLTQSCWAQKATDRPTSREARGKMAAVAGITIKGTNPVGVAQKTDGVAQKTNVLAQEARVVAQSTNNARENLKGAEGVCAVVQYDYEAQDDNELTLLEGQLIEQIDFIDDGWWAGIDPNGKTGIFPANYVELVDERLASSTGRFASSAPSPTDKGMVGIALYIYDAAEDNEISFQEGDRITEIEAVSEDWWQGKDKHGGIGLFPANYVELQV